eukprot:3808642-Alexandrium_andersonii.AAC.1
MTGARGTGGALFVAAGAALDTSEPAAEGALFWLGVGGIAGASGSAAGVTALEPPGDCIAESEAGVTVAACEP